MIAKDAYQRTQSGAGRAPRKEFEGQFGALYMAAGCPPLRALAALAQKRALPAPGAQLAVSAQRISDWKTGRNVPSRFEALRPVLLVLIDRARRRRETADAALLSLKVWRELWAQAQPSKVSRFPAIIACPFRGAAPYSRQDAAIFAGRSRAIGDLATLVHEAAASSGPNRLVGLVGAAGIGKTSLLQAGLGPALESSPARGWTVLSVCLGSDPVGSVTDEISRCSTLGRADAPASDADSSTDDQRLLIIDGFEVFSSRLLEDETRESFLRLLVTLTDVAVVLISLRPDCIAACGNYPVLADMLAHRSYVLEPMDSDELRSVISEPPSRMGVKVESGLEEVLLTIILGSRVHRSRGGHQNSNLAITSMTMDAMWPEREGMRLTIASFRRIGGIEGALHRVADAAWSDLSAAQQRCAKRLILNLVSIRADADDTRRRVHRDQLQQILGGTAAAADALEKLLRARLITVAEDEVYLSHDLLLTWPPLTVWLEYERPALTYAG
ncbi:ATP-binding protein [Nocardia sp. NPDC050412]|uniref:ATP-binding protein n=1 Tax=Nocardia sp. NPDC050412 TaxID=3364320 RepID=UPI00379B8F63